MHRAGTPESLFQVARFYSTCCVADASVVYATVSAPGPAPPRNSWIDVTGTLARQDGTLIVKASRIRRITQPDHPYLSASGTSTALAPAGDGTRPPDPIANRIKVTPPPKPGPALRTFTANRITRHGVTVTVTKVEFARTQTRVFTTIRNGSKARLTVFASESRVGGDTRAESNGRTFDPSPGSPGFPVLKSSLDPAEKTAGVITFDRMTRTEPLRLVISALSADARLGERGTMRFTLRWAADGKPS
jgi:hypothetical protein